MPYDAKFLHSGFECGRLQAQNLRCAAVASNAPTGHFQDVENVVPLHLFECLSGGPGAICIRSWKFPPEHCVRACDQEAFNYIAEFADISGPGVILEGLHG